jgi:hypothetical protein
MSEGPRKPPRSVGADSKSQPTLPHRPPGSQGMFSFIPLKEAEFEWLVDSTSSQRRAR